MEEPVYVADHPVELRRELVACGLALNEQWIPDNRAAKTALDQWQVDQFVFDLNQGQITLINPKPARVAAFVDVALSHGGPGGEAGAVLNLTASLGEIQSGGKIHWSRWLSTTCDRVTLAEWLELNGFPQ